MLRDISSLKTSGIVISKLLPLRNPEVHFMTILPTLDTVREIASAEKYTVLPVSCEILSDFTTPIETLRILKNISTHCYLLESAQANETWGRYSFLGFDPKLEITCVDGEMKIGSLIVRTDDPSESLRQILADFKSPRFDYLPSFTGDSSDTFPMTISVTASLPRDVRWKTTKLSKTSI